MAVRVTPTTNYGTLGGWGSALSGIGALYGAYNQNKISKKLFRLQQNALDEEKARKKRSQARLDYASANYLGHRDDNARLPIQY